MKAVIHDRYGPPGVLRIGEVERPAPKEGEVLVRVVATTVTRGDAMGVGAREYWFTRAFSGVFRPRKTHHGTEFAGIVEATGPGVTGFGVGDEVFGAKSGSNAEFVTIPESGPIAPKPANLTFEEAAAIPEGALLALTCLPPGAKLRGKDVLVYGAAGSIGSAAVQLLAGHFGAATLDAVCDTKDVDLVRSLGAHHVFDRFAEDFTKAGNRYDIIFDAVGKHSFRRCRRALKPGGKYISMDLGYLYHLPLLALWTRFFGSRRATVAIGSYRKEQLLLVKQLVEAGTYRPVIDRIHDIAEIVEATRYVASGKKSGSVVLRVAPASPPNPAPTD